MKAGGPGAAAAVAAEEVWAGVVWQTGTTGIATLTMTRRTPITRPGKLFCHTYHDDLNVMVYWYRRAFL